VVAAALVRLDQRHVVLFSPHALLLIVASQRSTDRSVLAYADPQNKTSKRCIYDSSKDRNKAQGLSILLCNIRMPIGAVVTTQNIHTSK
jgi:hypothetical protein